MNQMNARVSDLFHELADLSPEARAQYFAAHEVDLETRSEVEDLLAFDSGSSALLHRDLGAAAGDVLAQFEVKERPCGPYRLLKLIGRGGMGAVYLAERIDGEVRQRLAVKLLPPGAGDSVRQRFLQERQILASLAHPNIARMLDAGHVEHGQPFLAMEYVDGQPIDVFASEFTARQKIGLFLKVCAAVGYLHRNLIVHRDLKPSNILVTVEGEPKLLDFGIAKILDLATDCTLTSMRVLTPDYASPEQVSGLRISTATDIYSLGALLYHMLTGKPAHEFGEHSAESIARVITDREVTRPSKWASDLAGDIDFIVLKALRKDPQERYATVEQFAEDLQAFLESRPVRARSGNALYRARKFLRRSWLPVAATVLVVTSLSVGLYVANLETGWALAAEAKARVERDRAAAAEQTAGRDRDRAVAAEQVATRERNNAMAASMQAIEERNRAVTEKGRADEQAATAKAISEFLQSDLLAQASANTQARRDTKPDPDLTVRTALNRAAARIGGKFQKHPLVEAAIRQTIALTYRDLGLYSEAQPQSERAIDLRTRVKGEQDPDTLSAMRDLAEIYVFLGKFEPAQKLQSRVLEARRRLLGEEHVDTVDSMMQLAEAYQKGGRYAEAEPIAAKALELARRVLGEEHEGTMDALNELALVYVRENKYAAAEALFSKFVQTQTRLLGEEHPNTLRGISNLAGAYNREGKYQQAEALRSKALEIQRRVLGAEHVDTLVSMNNLGMTYLAQGKFAEAERIQKEALAGFSRVEGPDHPDMALITSNLARTYYSQGEYAKAEPLFSQSLEIRRRVLGPSHPDTTDALTLLAEVQIKQQRYTDAEQLLRDGLNTMEKTRPDHWRRFSAESLLGSALAGQQRYAEAEPLLLSGYAGLLQRNDTITATEKTHLADAGGAIVDLYRSWGQPDKAAEWQFKLENPK
jgi:tetratricopeptide (TPR) repeat protein/predicted Ser/Thr protein kinase